MKRGHVFSTWKKRLFVLDGSTLAYFGKPGDKDPKGVISLVGASLIYDAADDDDEDATTSSSSAPKASLLGGNKRNKQHTFTLVERPKAARLSEWGSGGGSDGGPTKHYIIEASSERERAGWIDAIQQNITIASVDLVGPVAPPIVLTPDAAAKPPTAAAASSSRAARVAAAASKRPVSIDGASSTSATSNSRPSSTAVAPLILSTDGHSANVNASNGASLGHGSVSEYLLNGGSSESLFFNPDLPPALRIWTGTWNMAEIAPPPGSMAVLLPVGCDVYAVGLQECMHTDAVLSAIRSHLGPEFQEVHHRVGSTIKRLGFHGHIAVAVYVKEWMVSSGFCKLSRAVRGAVALGKNLVITRAANKGAVAVALPIRLPDGTGALSVPSALIFVSCHLTSDASGKTKLKARNRNAHSMLQQLGLALTAAAISRAQSQIAAAAKTFASQQRVSSAASTNASSGFYANAAGDDVAPLLSPSSAADVLRRKASSRSLGSSASGAADVTGIDTADFIARRISLGAATAISTASGGAVAAVSALPDLAAGAAAAGADADGGDVGLNEPDDDDVDALSQVDDEGAADGEGGGDSAGSGTESETGAAAVGGADNNTSIVPLAARKHHRGSASASSSATGSVATGTSSLEDAGFGSDTGSTGQAEMTGASFVRAAASGAAEDDDGDDYDDDEDDDGEEGETAVENGNTDSNNVSVGGSGPGRPVSADLSGDASAAASASAAVSPSLMPRASSLRNLLGSSAAASPERTAGGDSAAAISSSPQPPALKSRLQSSSSPLHKGGSSGTNASGANPYGISPGRSYVIVLGDLNYRVQLSPEEALAALVAAGKAEMNVDNEGEGEDNAPIKIDVSAGKASGAFPHINEFPCEKPWMGLLAKEQLRQALQQGTAFPGFAEAPIRFPPSYRRKKSSVPLLVKSRGDWASLDAVRAGFSTVVHKKKDKHGHSADGSVGGAVAVAADGSATTGDGIGTSDAAPIRPGQLRTPSYTDRILLRSPLLTGVPVRLADYTRDRARRKSKRLGPGAAAAALAEDRYAPISTASSSSTASSPGAVASLTFVPFPPMKCVSYDENEAVLGSDHVPITATWELPLRPDGQSSLFSSSNASSGDAVAAAAGSGSSEKPRPPFPILMPGPVTVLESIAVRLKRARRQAAAASAAGGGSGSVPPGESPASAQAAAAATASSDASTGDAITAAAGGAAGTSSSTAAAPGPSLPPLPVDAATLRLAEKAKVAPAPPPNFSISPLLEADEGCHASDPHPTWQLAPRMAEALASQGALYGYGMKRSEEEVRASLQLPPVLLPWHSPSSAHSTAADLHYLELLEPSRKSWPALYSLAPPPFPPPTPVGVTSAVASDDSDVIVLPSLPPGAPASLARIPLALLPPETQASLRAGKLKLMNFSGGVTAPANAAKQPPPPPPSFSVPPPQDAARSRAVSATSTTSVIGGVGNGGLTIPAPARSSVSSITATAVAGGDASQSAAASTATPQSSSSSSSVFMVRSPTLSTGGAAVVNGLQKVAGNSGSGSIERASFSPVPLKQVTASSSTAGAGSSSNTRRSVSGSFSSSSSAGTDGALPSTTADRQWPPATTSVAGTSDATTTATTASVAAAAATSIAADVSVGQVPSASVGSVREMWQKRASMRVNQ